MAKPSVYKTKQREAILKFMKQNKENMVTARTIYDSFLNLDNPIGMATIYRHLEELTQQGVLSKYSISGIPAACFKYEGSNIDGKRAHLMCENCGNLTKLDCDFLNNINSHLLTEHRFNVNPKKMIFYGKCKECMSKG